MRADIVKLRSLLSDGAAFGINVFAPPGHGAGAAEVVAYAETLSGEAERSDTALGEPRWDDDSYAEKLELLCAERVAVVSFTFGCPAREDVERLHGAGTAVWVTATTPRRGARRAARPAPMR